MIPAAIAPATCTQTSSRMNRLAGLELHASAPTSRNAGSFAPRMPTVYGEMLSGAQIEDLLAYLLSP